MSISARGFQYLNFLSDFWRVFYSDASVLETILRTEAEIVKSMYFTILQEQVPRAVQDARVFKEEFWNLIELVYEDTSFEVVTRKGQTFYSYPLDESYAHLPQLYNIIFNPTVRLKEGKDFFIERELSDPLGESAVPTVTSRILFKDDPFLNNDIPKRITTDNKLSMVLFAPKAFIDDMQLFSRHGDLLDIVDLSSEEYKAFLHGVMYLFTNGPSISALNAGISLAAGYPVARQTEVINSVLIEEGVYYLSSDQGNVYEFPRKIISTFNELTQSVESIAYPTLRMSGASYQDEVGNVLNTVNFSDASLVDGSYPTFFEVDSFDPFISDLRIVDAETEPYWWRKQVDKLASTLVPDLPDELRSHPGVKDYLFETYFKFNTFGVFVDYRAFREDFQKLPDFMDIIMKVKPSYKSFVVYEDELHVFSLVRLRPDESASLQSSVSISPNPSPVVNPDGTISEPPRSTDIPTPGTDPVTGLPTNGIDPATGQPYPPNILDNINNVFDAIALRNFLGIYDVKSITPFVGMTLPLDNAPIRLGIGLENLRHSIDTVFWTIVLSPESLVRLTPAIEPIIGMGVRLGMGTREGILERHSFKIGLTPDEEEQSYGEDNDPVLTELIVPEDIVLLAPVVMSVFADVSWEASTAPVDSYDIYLLDATTNTIVLDYVDVGLALSYSFTGLDPEHAYSWGVRGVSLGVEGDVTLSGFTTPSFSIDAPVFSANTDLNQFGTTLNWAAVTYAESYILYVENLDISSVIVNNVDIGNVLTYTLDTLDPATNYRVLLKAFHPIETSSYSSANDFLTFDPTPEFSPTMLTSSNVMTTSVTFRWTSVLYADTYTLEVYDDTGLTNLIFSESGIADTEKNVTGLLDGTTFYARANGSNESGTGPWGSANTTATPSALAVPVAIEETNVGVIGKLPNTFTANWGSTSGATSYILTIAEDLSLTVPISNYNQQNLGNSVLENVVLDLETDAYELISWKLQDNNSSIVSSVGGNLSGTLNGTQNWLSSLISSDTYSLKLNGITNHIQTTNQNTTLDDFTIRLLLRFEVGDKASLSEHILFTRYNTNLSFPNSTGAIFYTSYDSTINKLNLVVSDSSDTFASPKYRIWSCDFNPTEGIDYLLQFSFKKVDPLNSNLNTIIICINGVSQSLTNNDSISNINNLNIFLTPYYLGTYVGAYGTYKYGKFRCERAYFSTRFRTEAEALKDAQNLGLSPQTLYYGVKATNGVSTSAYSNVITVNTPPETLQQDSFTRMALNLDGDYLDSTLNGNNATPVNSPSFTTSLLQGDTNSLLLDGIDDVVQIPNAVSSNRDITVRMVLRFNSFTRASQYLYTEWYGQAASVNYTAKLEIYYDKTNNRFDLYLFDETYNGGPSTSKYVGYTVNATLSTTDTYYIAFSWDNTSKVATFNLNGVNQTLNLFSFTPTPTITPATLNLADTISPNPIYFGGYTYPNVLYSTDSPHCTLARLYIDSIARSSSFFIVDYNRIASIIKIGTTLQIDTNTTIALELAEGSGTALASRSPATIAATIVGTTTSIWQANTLSTYALELNGSNNYIATPANNTPLTDFTSRVVFRFDTGDKTSKTIHVLACKYNTTGSSITGFVWCLEYNSSTNKLYLTINDTSATWLVAKSRTFEVSYSFVENADYAVQASFKLVDPANSNLNTVEICVNGAKITGGAWVNTGISNISAVISGNVPFYFGAYLNASGIAVVAKYRLHKGYFDTTARSEGFALLDAQRLGLA